MGGDDSQKLMPWRGAYSSPGRAANRNIKTFMLKAIYSDPAPEWVAGHGAFASGTRRPPLVS